MTQKNPFEGISLSKEGRTALLGKSKPVSQAELRVLMAKQRVFFRFVSLLWRVLVMSLRDKPETLSKAHEMLEAEFPAAGGSLDTLAGRMNYAVRKERVVIDRKYEDKFRHES